MRYLSLSLVLSAFARIGEANLSGPRPTLSSEASPQTGFSPKTTAKPQLGQQVNNIFERQEGGETCGFVEQTPVTCNYGLQCAIDTSYGAGGCCPQGTCYIATTCIEADAVQYDCDANCLNNPRNLLCSDSDYPFCQGLIFNYAPPYTGYMCAPFTEGVEFYTVTPNNAITPETLVYATSAAPQSQSAPVTVTLYPSSGSNGGNGDGNNIHGNNNTQIDGNTYIYNNTAVRAFGSETTLLRWLLRSGAFIIILTLVL